MHGFTGVCSRSNTFGRPPRGRVLAVAAAFGAIFLLGGSVSNAQESQPEFIACPHVPGYEAPPDDEIATRTYQNGEWGGDCYYAPLLVDRQIRPRPIP